MNATVAGAAGRQLSMVVAAALIALEASAGHAKEREQFVPVNVYRVGPYASSGSAVAGGMRDYLQMLNTRDGGINGVKFTWEKCGTEFNNLRAIECYGRMKNQRLTGANLIEPLPAGMSYAPLDGASADEIPTISLGYGRADAADGSVFPYVFPLVSTYWSQAATMIRYIGEKERGLDKLRGKHIAMLYHDSAYGKEPIPVLTELAAKYRYRLSTIPVPDPGNEQQSQWLQIRELRPDWVILWGWGVMNPTALKAAARAGYPRRRMVGVWWSGAEEDVIPAGLAAKDFVAAGLNVSGTNYPVIRNIQRYVHAKVSANINDEPGVGSIYYNRGVVIGIITAEAVRIAQRRFGKSRPLTGKQVRLALEHLRIDAARLNQLGASGLMPPLKTSCADHEGSGLVRFMKWDEMRWNIVTDWMAPTPEDRKVVHQKYLGSAASYARTKGITPRRCPAS